MRTGGDVEGRRTLQGREGHTLSAHLLNCPFTVDRETIRQSQNVLFVPLPCCYMLHVLKLYVLVDYCNFDNQWSCLRHKQNRSHWFHSKWDIFINISNILMICYFKRSKRERLCSRVINYRNILTDLICVFKSQLTVQSAQWSTVFLERPSPSAAERLCRGAATPPWRAPHWVYLHTHTNHNQIIIKKKEGIYLSLAVQANILNWFCLRFAVSQGQPIT